MRLTLLLAAMTALTGNGPASAQYPPLTNPDRIRLAEAFRLADNVAEYIWPGWSEIPMAVLLVTPEYEYLVRHPRPSEDFVEIARFDSLLQSPVFVRSRQNSPTLLATFPAVGGIATIVVGQPAQTGKSSTLWVTTLLHEHFHQLQYSQPDYYGAVAELDLAGDDDSGMWMLNYPFPYSSQSVGGAFDKFVSSLVSALGAARTTAERGALSRLDEAWRQLRETLDPADYRYLSFQLWQEGVSRYTEHRVAEIAALLHVPLPAFEQLEDFTPYPSVADSLRHRLARELESADLSAQQRVVFYPVGAAVATLLDATSPGWQREYHVDRFYLERYRSRH